MNNKILDCVMSISIIGMFTALIFIGVGFVPGLILIGIAVLLLIPTLIIINVHPKLKNFLFATDDED